LYLTIIYEHDSLINAIVDLKFLLYLYIILQIENVKLYLNRIYL